MLLKWKIGVKNMKPENSLNRLEILQKIKENLLTPEQGFRMLKNLPSDTASVEESFDTLYFQEVWEKKSIQDNSFLFSTMTVLFDIDERLQTALEDYYRKRGESGEVVLVKPGKEYEQTSEKIFFIRPDQPQDYQKLVSHWKEKNFRPERVIYSWSKKGLFHDSTELSVRLKKGIYSLFHLIQAWLVQKVSKADFIYLYSGDSIQPDDVAIHGFARSLHQETSQIFLKTVEIDVPYENTDQIALLVMQEFQANRDNIQIRYSKNQRWIKTFREMTFLEDRGNEIFLRHRGTYLITGGAGALGLIFARYLAKETQGNILLLGRSPLQEHQRKKIEEIRSLGARVEYTRCDVSLPEDLQNCIESFHREFQHIHGVIHSAGVIHDSLIVKKNSREMDAVFGSKILGIVNLDNALKDEPLDFFVMFSSISAAIGNIGQSDYAFANSFLDAFAKWRVLQKKPGKTLSLAWPLWQEGGMKVSTQTQEWRENKGLGTLETSQGWIAFSHGLLQKEPCLLVMNGHTQKIRHILGLEPPQDKNSILEPKELSREIDVPRLRQDLMQIVAEILKVEVSHLDIEEEMSNYGFDSITITSFINKVNTKYELMLTPAIFFEHPSIGGFSEYIQKEYREKMLLHYAIQKEKIPSKESLLEKAEPEIPRSDRPLRRLERKANPITRKEEKNPEDFRYAPIAIIGMAGILPGSADIEDFWYHLEEKHDLISEVPSQRWDWQAIQSDSLQRGLQVYARWGGFVQDIDRFDADFFNISSREADWIDPQHRIFLETVWKVLEDAGYKPSSLSGSKTGLFVGACTADYREILSLARATSEALYPTGNLHAVLGNRVSYWFNFRGPSEVIDTACSSSLVAIHRAIASLHADECDMAIAGGVSALLTPSLFSAFSKAGMLSPDGRCKTFDQKANGYVRGEGSGAILLKPLKKAQKDGNNIYAVIKGSAVNHGGHVSSLTVPNPNAQADLLLEAYTRSGISLETISYIETHGTGTSLGDPIEVNGLKKAFSSFYQKSGKTFSTEPYCALGSVKTNIGHLEAAAGIAGILKVLLSMKHKMLPGTVHFHNLNPYIQLEGTPFYIVEKTQPWPAKKENNALLPRRAGISSFGFGGANAHIVLEEYEEKIADSSSSSLSGYVFLLSARNEERLKEYARIFADFLKKHPSLKLSELTYTMQVCRESLEQRIALFVASINELQEKLAQYAQGISGIENCYTGNARTEKGKADLLLGDEEGEIFLNNVVQKKRWYKLAQLWVLGIEIPWTILYEDPKPSTLSLPGYPFQKKRHWIKAENKEEKASFSEYQNKSFPVHEVAYQADDSAHQFFYIPRWIPSSGRTKALPAPGRKKILFLYSSDALSIKESLEELHSQDEIQDIVLSTTTKIQETIANCLSKIDDLDTVYFLGAIQKEFPEFYNLAAIRSVQDQSILSFFRLTKALIAKGFCDRPLEVKIITNSSVEIKQGDLLNPGGASLYGLSSSWSKEYEKLAILCSDIVLQDDLSDVLRQIVWEKVRPGFTQIAFREGKSYCKVLYPISLPSAQKTPFRERGVYLILGGAGGIGLEFALHLASTVKARLALLGRSEPQEKQKKIFEEIIARGGEIAYWQADATDRDSIEKAIAKVKEHFGAIHGVIHCALVLRDQSLRNMNEEDFLYVMNPKCIGSINLYQAICKENLDFMMFFSSAQSFISMPGQANYVTASSFQDAFSVHLAAQCHFPIRNINWGYWGNVGIVSSQDYRKKMEKTGILSIEEKEGISAIERILSQPCTQIVALKAHKSILDQIQVQEQCRMEAFPAYFPSLIEKGIAIVRNWEGINTKGWKQELDALNRFSCLLLRDVIQCMADDKAIWGNQEAIKQVLQIVPAYDRLYEAILKMLKKADFLKVQGESVAFPSHHEKPKFTICLERWEEEKKYILAKFPLIEYHVHLLVHCLKHYRDILQGRILATDFLFPDSSLKLVECIYKGNEISDYFNRLAGFITKTYIQSRLPLSSSDSIIRILEIGAGTGGTSALILEAIEAYSSQVNYVYTDISPAFTNYGKKEYADRYPFLQFSLLDIEKDVCSQGYRAGDFDVVIAANVIHATHCISSTLRNAKRLLKRNGWLILNEVTASQDYLTLIFGLLEGWWHFQDTEERLPDSPLIGSPSWKRILEREGFHSVQILPSQAEGLQQSIIVAESDGITFVERNLESSDCQKSKETVCLFNKKTPEKDSLVSQEKIQTFIDETIQGNLANVLGVEKKDIELDLQFADCGVDSILGIELIHKINHSLGIGLKTTILFDYTNARDLSRHVYQVHKESIRKNLVAESDTTSPQEDQKEDHLPVKQEILAQEQTNIAKEIAIIGMAGRFPGARDTKEFWQNIAEGKNSIREIPKERWNIDEYYDPDPQNSEKIYCRWGGFLEEIEQFDTLFFNISGKEAELTDPQQRLFLEESWHALEDAGYANKETLGSSCGVFLGVAESDYYTKIPDSSRSAQAFWGNDRSILSARLSYFLDLKGPAIAIDTACSSSLTAIHLACQSISNGEIKMALAGGIFLTTTPRFYKLASTARMLSADGQCKTFDNRANGFVPGEGVGVLVLKSLDAAIKDRDHIYAIIKASGLNQDGKTNGITAPSALSQTQLERAIYEKARINPETLSYIEAHGTGTKLGDPIEMEALTNAFRLYTNKKQFCAIGSVKTNIGHAIHAAGVAGVIKILQAMNHKLIPPSLNFSKPNENIDFANSPFWVNTKLQSWKNSPSYPRRAAISSFGFSGTNCHIVLEEPPAFLLGKASHLPCYLVVLSARSKQSLEKMIENLAFWLDQEGKDSGLLDLAYTLQTGRTAFDLRCAFVVKDHQELLDCLRSYDKREISTIIAKPNQKEKEIAHTILLELAEASDSSHAMYQEKMKRLAKLWLSGIEIEWQNLYKHLYPRRIPLPLYPFSRQRYWLEKEPIQNIYDSKLISLVSKIESGLHETKYISEFTGQEFFLKDHQVSHNKILPAVVYLEMAASAANNAFGLPARKIHHVVWIQPVVVPDRKEVFLTLHSAQESVKYEIYSQKENKKILHGQGEIVLQKGHSYSPEDRLDIVGIQARCSRKIEKEECYSIFHKAGIDYGDSFQGIQEIYANSTEALSSLKWNGVHDLERFFLHPSIMDSALQTVLGLLKDSSKDSFDLALPFAMDSMEIFSCVATAKYAYIEKEAQQKSGIFCCQVTISDEYGHPLVRMHGLCLKSIPGKHPLFMESPLDPRASQSESLSQEKFLSQTQEYLRKVLAEETKLSLDMIDIQAPFEKYGIDSLMILNLTRKLENDLGQLPKTLFYEYENLSSLAKYFLEKHEDGLKRKFSASLQISREKKDSQVVKQNTQEISIPSISQSSSDIAIIGVSGRYPQAENLEEFWKNLKEGKDCITEIPPDRWEQSLYYDPKKGKPGKIYSKWGGFLLDVDKFDPLFFNISPREAHIIDPQERLFLEIVWETLEDAGYTRKKLEKYRTGVYAGVMYNEYPLVAKEEGMIGAYSGYASIANRISYFLNVHGPSMALDSMCSSSLTAIHLACESIARGEIELAIAGGVNVTIHPNKYVYLSHGHFASSDGRCRSFGEGGDGYVAAEGVGAVLLKSLDRAVAERDRISAIIKGSVLNHGGKTSGYTVPNPNLQSALVREALQKTKINPRTISYIEAHGTGTSLGDPIEISGLSKAFGFFTTDRKYCAIGSVKSNIGHAESAAGIAGISKLLLQFRDKKLVPSLHSRRINPHIQFDQSPFYVQQELAEWKRPSLVVEGKEEIFPLRAGISSFGAGGSNAHIILEEYIPSYSSSCAMDTCIIVLSARNEERLRAYAQKMADFLVKKDQESDIVRLAYTLQTGREAMEERLAFLASNLGEIIQKLEDFVQGKQNIENFYRGSVGDRILQDERKTEQEIQKFLQEKAYDRIAALWASHVEIEWDLLYSSPKPVACSLPAYPFARERYWFKQDKEKKLPSVQISSAKEDATDILYYESIWQESVLEKNIPLPHDLLLVGQQNEISDILNSKGIERVIRVMPEKDSYGKLLGSIFPDTIVYFFSRDSFSLEEKSLKQDLEQGIYSFYQLVQCLLSSKKGNSVNILYVYESQEEHHPLDSAISGFVRTLYQENPQFHCKVIAINHGVFPVSKSQIAEILWKEMQSSLKEEIEISYQNGNRMVKKLRQVPAPLSPCLPSLKQNGVYLITGGMGGLGLIFARDLAARFQARLVLSGRTEVKDVKQSELKMLYDLGAKEVLYVKADCSKRQEIFHLLEETRVRFGKIDGVFHSAGVIRDSFILKKTPEEIHAVLEPKIYGAIFLDELTKNDDLDCFVLFSSLSAVTGNLGQSDYAYANAFLDAFARIRNAWEEKGKRKGRSLSMGWPLWKEGGMHVAPSIESYLKKSFGLVPLETKHGIHALEHALSLNIPHLIVVEGIQEQLRSYLEGSPVETKEKNESAWNNDLKVILQEKTEVLLKELLYQETQIPSTQIQAQENFASYGIDSVMILNIITELENILGPISPKTLFFDYPSVQEMTEYLTQKYHEPLFRHFGMEKKAESTEKKGLPEISLHEPEQESSSIQDIAIIGISGRYPMAEDLQGFWENLQKGKDCITEIPAERWDYEPHYDPDKSRKGKTYTKWGGFISDVDKFDPMFFKIPPKVAQSMDPQQRLFLETVYCAIEDSGYTKKNLVAGGRDVGVFVGVMWNEYQLSNERAYKQDRPSFADASYWAIANRVSYFFDFHGPSMAVDTACSSSLTAIHIACESIRRKECSVAVAGGVNISIHPAKYILLSQDRLPSSDGRCRSFGEGGDGYVPGEGVGAVVLKPLSKAVQDKDHIYCVIRGSSINHGGKTQGFHVPDAQSQTRCLTKALENAKISPRVINYVEAQGTGTVLGDFAEIAALTEVFNRYTKDRQYCSLGSVKSNVGHLEAAGGIVAVSKVLLQMQHKKLVPSLHSQKPNSKIVWEQTPFYLQHTLEDWKRPVCDGKDYPRTAIVSCFGAGGSNSHLILSEYESIDSVAPKTESSEELVLISAQEEKQLQESIKKYLLFLQNRPDISLENLAYTTQTGREHFAERLAIVCKSLKDLIEKLSLASDTSEATEGIYRSKKKSKKEMVSEKEQKEPGFFIELLRKRRFFDIASYWVKGSDIPWEALEKHPQRISLPTYPFVKEKCWVMIE